MIKLNMRSITVLTDEEVKLVSGGVRTDLHHSQDNCDSSWFCSSNECESYFCASNGCDSWLCGSEGHCDSNGCTSFDCDSEIYSDYCDPGH